VSQASPVPLPAVEHLDVFEQDRAELRSRELFLRTPDVADLAFVAADVDSIAALSQKSPVDP
jgi:hypothetical protein